MEKVWWKEAVCYQVYPRSFMDSNGDGIGDLRGILSKLDYLEHLGIDVIWICPFYQSPNADNGYDISDYQQTAKEYGTMADFDELLKEAHSRNMKIILDLVVNHTSDEHPWFIESRSSKTNSRRDWYIWKDGKNGAEPNNWESIFSGSAWKYDKTTEQYYLHLFAEKQPDLNWENNEMRTAVYGMINWWLDKGIDGFRVDAISHIKKREAFPDMPNTEGKKYVESFDMHMNQPGIQKYLRDLKESTFAKYDIMTVGEANGVLCNQASEWVSEKNGIFNMVFQFEHINLWSQNARNGFDVVAFKSTLSKWQTALLGVGWNALYLENHDIARSVSTIGNCGQYWRESAKMLAMMYFFMQGTPFIYQGQEIGMTNADYTSIEDYDDIRFKNFYYTQIKDGANPDELLEIIQKTGRDNARTPMQWSAELNAGFTAGVPWLKVNSNYTSINAASQQNDENSILAFYQRMIHLRKSNEVLIYGSYALLFENDPNVFVYKREYEGKIAIVVCNMKADKPVVHLDDDRDQYEILLTNVAQNQIDSQFTIQLQPYEAILFVSKA